jgi:flagellar assembly protein FliH
MSLIKSTKVIGQPVVLAHARKAGAAAAPVDAALPVENVTLPLHADAQPAPPAVDMQALRREIEREFESTLALTYEEYQKRFESELQALTEQAKQQGLEQGVTEGRALAQQEYAARLDAFAKLLASARQTLEQNIDGIGDLTIEVVCEAVAKIVGAAVVQREAMVASLREVIRRAKERTKLVVCISPTDWAVLEGHEAELIEGLNVGSVELVADDRVQAGGCLLETPAGNLDGRLEVQLERLRDILLSARPTASDIGDVL